MGGGTTQLGPPLLPTAAALPPARGRRGWRGGHVCSLSFASSTTLVPFLRFASARSSPSSRRRQANVALNTSKILPPDTWASFSSIPFLCLPRQAASYGLDLSGVRRFSSFYLAIQEINNKSDGVADHLLPDTNLSFALRDSKRSSGEAFFGSLELASEAFGNQGVSAIIGAASSSPSSSVALVAAQFQIPQISYSATSPLLSDGKQYPYFMRTPPSDAFEAEGIADVLRNLLNYTVVGTVNSDDNCMLVLTLRPLTLLSCSCAPLPHGSPILMLA